MNEEKLMILKMIDEGKINPDEGVKLIKAIDGKNVKTGKEIDFEKKIKDFSENVDSFAKESKEWIDGVAKDVEPKVKKTAKVVMEKTASVVDDLSKILRDMASSISASLEKNEAEDKPADTDDDPKEN